MSAVPKRRLSSSPPPPPPRRTRTSTGTIQANKTTAGNTTVKTEVDPFPVDVPHISTFDDSDYIDDHEDELEDEKFLFIDLDDEEMPEPRPLKYTPSHSVGVESGLSKATQPAPGIVVLSDDEDEPRTF